MSRKVGSVRTLPRYPVRIGVHEAKGNVETRVVVDYFAGLGLVVDGVCQASSWL